MFTENCTEETRKSKKGKRSVLMYTTFSSLRSSTEESVESNRIDFPKQIRIKRKYLNKLNGVSHDVSQVYKGIRRMPRRFETKKDAISCDKPWLAASKH